MNASTLRGVAALALLCLLPRMSALTIVQTISAPYFARQDSDVVIASFGWDFAPFQAGGTFLSANLSGTNTVTVTQGGPHFQPGSITYTPQVLAGISITIAGSPFPLNGPSANSVFSEPTLTLAPNITHTTTATFDQAFGATYSGSSLYFFGAESPSRLSFALTGFGNNPNNGSITVSGTAFLTLTYTYDAADAGNSATLGVLAFLTLAAHRRTRLLLIR